MGYFELDERTRPLLQARGRNGVGVVIDSGNEYEVEAMQQMLAEGLFNRASDPFSQGDWWTSAGEQAANEAWEAVPVEQIETCYRGHPQVLLLLTSYKEERCYVTGPNYTRSGSGLYVRELDPGRWLVDHPYEDENVPFGGPPTTQSHGRWRWLVRRDD